MKTLPLLLFATALALPACGSLPAYYEEDPPDPAPLAVEGYAPPLYDGYVVYYDDIGHPYYYDDGGAVWIQPEWPGYWGYVNHYQAYGGGYHRWYAAHGAHYRGWRGGGGHGGGFRGGGSHGGGGHHH